MLATAVTQSSSSRGIKREIEDDDDGWMRPSKRLLIDETLEMDEEDVFTVGGGGTEPEHGYAIRPPPVPAVARAPSAPPALNFAIALNPVTVPMATTVAEPLAILTSTTLDTLVPTPAVPTVAISAAVLDSVVPIAPTPMSAPTVVTSAPALEPIIPIAPTPMSASPPPPVATVTPIADPLIATVPTLSPISGPTLAIVPSVTPAPLDTARLRSLDEFNTSLLPDLHNLMETLRWGCPSHYLLGINDPWEHRAGSCTLDKCNNRDAGWKSWRRFYFSENICWGCGVERDVSSSFRGSSASLT